MIKLPFGVDINNLIDDLRIFSWEAADILLFYSKIIKNPEKKREIIQTKKSSDPVTIADLKVNQLIISRIQEKYEKTNWQILSEENVKIKPHNCNIKADWCWVLDPLDGTKDFIQGTGNYAMHLALNYKQKPILGIVLIPERDELWISKGNQISCENRQGIRREIKISRSKPITDMTVVTSKNHINETLEKIINKVNFKKVITMGSIGCKVASIIRGDSDIYISLSLPGQSSPKDWDFAAPEAILRAAGGAITNLDNQSLTYNSKTLEHPGIIIATNNLQTHAKICSQVKEIIIKFEIFPDLF